MVKRFVIEYANYKKEALKDTTPDIIRTFSDYSNKVIGYAKRGLITNDEAIKMLTSVDIWELSHGCPNRFNG